MHPLRLRAHAVQMRADGVPFRDVCARLGLPRGTVAHWYYGERARRAPADRGSACPRCRPDPGPPTDPGAYAYLLGLYLGDGHLVTGARTPVLRIYCADAWPGLIAECEAAMRAVLARSVHRVAKTGCVGVQSYSAHWPCLLPQHGPGRKHLRPIRLESWQRALVDAHSAELLRGLFHSDGCRTVNRIHRGGRTYAYPRYMFSNESTDIMQLCQDMLDRLSVPWRMCRPNMLAVSTRDAVATLDAHVGPKW